MAVHHNKKWAPNELDHDISNVLKTFSNHAANEKNKFPDDFEFGASTAAYQIEGAWDTDGKGPSIWDTFTHQHPELIKDASTGDVAADSYQFYEEDIKAIKRLGVSFFFQHLYMEK